MVVLGEENSLAGVMLSFLSQLNSFSIWISVHIWPLNLLGRESNI